MKNLPKEKRNQIILVALGTAIILAGLWQGLVRAQQNKLKAIALATADQEHKVSNAQRLVTSTAQIQKDLGKVAEKLKTIENEMASGDMYSWIIQTLNNFLTTHNFRTNNAVEIPQFSREVTGEVGLFPKFPYRAATFNVRGTAYFHDFGKFVADLENTYPFLRVQNLELEPAVGNPTASNVAAGSSDSEKLAFKMEIVALVNPSGR